jgi:hypothetical protein
MAQYPNSDTDAQPKREEEAKKIKVLLLQCSSPCNSSNTNTTKTIFEVQVHQKRHIQEGNGAQASSSLDQRS